MYFKIYDKIYNYVKDSYKFKCQYLSSKRLFRYQGIQKSWRLQYLQRPNKLEKDFPKKVTIIFLWKKTKLLIVFIWQLYLKVPKELGYIVNIILSGKLQTKGNFIKVLGTLLHT